MEIFQLLCSCRYRTQHSRDWVTPIVFFIILCTDRVENTVSNSNSIAERVFVAAGTCLLIRYIEMIVVCWPIAQSLNSNTLQYDLGIYECLKIEGK
jgi:hypothetical protein